MMGLKNSPKTSPENVSNAIIVLGSAIALIILGTVYFLNIDPSTPVQKEVVERNSEGCIFIGEEYCSSGVRIEYLGILSLGFNLPEGTNVYAPFDGEFISSGISGITTNGTITSLSPDGVALGTSFSFTAEYIQTVQSGVSVKKGELLGQVKRESAIALIHESSDSNLVVTIQSVQPDGPSFNDPRLLDQFFRLTIQDF